MDNINLLLYLAFLFIAKAVSDNTFPLGSEYTYTYANDVYVYDFSGGKPIAYRLTGTLQLACILQEESRKVLKFKIDLPQLHVRPHGSWSQTEFSPHRSFLDNVKNHEFYAVWENGDVEKFVSHQNENVSLKNLKKALVSLFQFKLDERNFIEKDVSGSCDITYRQTTPVSYARFKVKCNATNIKEFYSRNESPVKVLIQSHRNTEIKFLRDDIEVVDSRDYFHISFAANTKVGGSVDSTINLKVQEHVSTVSTSKSKTIEEFLTSLSNYKSSSLIAKTQTYTENDLGNIKKIVKERASDLESNKIGTASAAHAFLKILPVARGSNKDDVVKVLKATTLKEQRVSKKFDLKKKNKDYVYSPI